MAKINGKNCASPKLIITSCWLAYALAYMLRVNIAVAIPAIVHDLGYSYSQMGLVMSMFFISYTIGQLINGYIGDRINSKILIVVGLGFSAICNIAIVMFPYFSLIMLFWTLNGFFQSMLWAPMMKLISLWFNINQLSRISFIMASSGIVGYALSWGSTSLLVWKFKWQTAFTYPALLVLLFTIYLFTSLQEKPQKEEYKDDTSKTMESNIDTMSNGKFLRLVSIPSLLLIAFSQGVIREGIGIWFPTILNTTERFANESPWFILVLVPIVNLLGILLVRFVNYKHRGNNMRTLIMLFTFISLTNMLLFVFIVKNTSVMIIALFSILALTHGITPILTSSIPFQFVTYRKVSLMAGIIDCAIYMGAAVSGTLSGFIADFYGWRYVVIIWICGGLAGLLFSIWRWRFSKTCEIKSISTNDQV